MRTKTVLVSAVLAAVSFGSTLANGVIYTPTPLPQCAGLVTQNCIVSLTRNGSPETI